MRLFAPAAVALLIAALAAAQTNNTPADSETPAEPELPLGWEWELPPSPLYENWAENVFSRFVESGLVSVLATPTGDVIATHVRNQDLDLTGSRRPEFKLSLIDRDGTMHEPRGWSMISNGELSVTQHRFTGIDDWKSIEKIALAVLTFDGRRARAEDATHRARAAGADVMPLPVIGETYAFDVPTMDGGRISSADLKGKVVLIDFWATWCGPCMAKMPQLKELHEKHADDGLVVIGVTMDDEAAPAREAVEEHGLEWAQVHARGAASGHDEFWNEITGIRNIPRLLIIDRDGVLRADLYPHDLEAQVGPYLEDGEEGDATTDTEG